MYSLGRTRGHIQGQIKGQKPDGPQAPRVWPTIWSRVRLQKIPKGALNILTLSTQGTSQGLHSPCCLRGFPTDFHFFYLTQQYINVKREKHVCSSRDGLETRVCLLSARQTRNKPVFQWDPRKKCGKCQQQQVQTLTLLIQVYWCVRQKECTFYPLNRTLYTVHCTLYTGEFSWFTVQCTLYICHFFT